MRALVTGGAGFVGSNLVDALVGRGDSVRVLDELSTGRRANVHPDAVLLQGDVRDPAAVGKAIEGSEVVFHLAAQVDVRRSVADPAHDLGVNAGGTVTVLEAARAAGGREHQMPHAPLARRVEHIERAGDVDGEVVVGVGDRAADVDLGAEVEDELRPGGLENVAHRRGVGERGLLERRELVDVLAPPRADVVEHGHRRAAPDERVDQVGADEAGPAGHEGDAAGHERAFRSPAIRAMAVVVE